ncbi:MAG: DUF4743 domain-containing protein, partial [Acetobacteraceae bacterium]|nr:DUF4743 domain-containing protein [Acetobacteraceae bacterium]
MQRQPGSAPADIDGFLRHIHACNNAVLPGWRIPFQLAGHQVGWVLPELAEILRGFPHVTRS